MPPPSALVVGESLIDVVRTPASTTEHVGGSAANAAVALSRLGCPTSLVTRVGDDERGRRIVERLEAEGVELVGAYAGARRTSAAVATIGADGAASYEFDITWDLPPVVMPGGSRPDLVHACSIAAVLAPGAAQVHDLLARLAETAVVSYDLNLRPGVTGTGPDVVASVERLVALSDVVRASDEDLEALLPGTTLADAAARLLGLGPAAVVVTRGGDGATWFGRGGPDDTVTARARPVDVVDTVGAGDTFGAALLVALAERGLLARGQLQEVSPDVRAEVLDFASAAARVTVSRAGADPPYRDELR